MTKIKTAASMGSYFVLKYEDGDFHTVNIPEGYQNKPYQIRKGKLYVGPYVYNPASDSWDKVSKILLLLMRIWDAIKDVFEKQEP